MKGIYSGLKEVWGPQTKQPVHLKSSDGLESFTDSKCYGKMERILSEITQCSWGPRTRGAGKHTKAQCEYCPG